MARNPRNTAAATGGTNGSGATATADLTTIAGSIETANKQREEAIAQLQSQRTGHVNSIAQIDTMLSGLGVETESAAPVRGRGRRGGRRAAKTGGGKGSRGKRDPLGMKGYIARELVKAGTAGLTGAALTEQIGKAGWPNANSPTFNTQVYQVAGKMVKDGVAKSLGRGQYAPTAKTAKFLSELQASIKAAA